ncbi:MAG: nucleotide exchange factor GrpE [Candidatus Margulisiibacteriota bacterium]
MTKKEPKPDVKKNKKVKSAPKKSAETISMTKFEALSDELNSVRNELIEASKSTIALSAECDNLKEQSLRSLAELENVKRRKEQEKNDAIKFANERFILDLLPVLDGFDLAMSQLGVATSEETKAVIVGFEMIQKQIIQFLEKVGVVRIQALDQPFDPNFHQGISKESHQDKDENTVVKEMQSGYTLNNRVIRPAMVVVSTK